MAEMTHTVKDVQRLLGLSRTKIYQLIHWKEMPGFRIGGRILIPKKEFQDFYDDLVRRGSF